MKLFNVFVFLILLNLFINEIYVCLGLLILMLLFFMVLSSKFFIKLEDLRFFFFVFKVLKIKYVLFLLLSWMKINFNDKILFLSFFSKFRGFLFVGISFNWSDVIFCNFVKLDSFFVISLNVFLSFCFLLLILRLIFCFL